MHCIGKTLSKVQQCHLHAYDRSKCLTACKQACTATADLVQLGNDFLIVLSGGCQLCQVDLLLPFLLVLHLSHDSNVTQKTRSWFLSTVMD